MTKESVVSAVERLKRVVLSLPEVELRIGWLREQVSTWEEREAALLLNELCEQSERLEAHAREAQLALALLVVSLGDSTTLDGLRRLSQQARLLSLERLLRRGPPPAVIAQEPSVPQYNPGRELTVGERRSLARRPNRKAFERLLADPHPLVIAQLLQNPKLTEDDVVRLAARRPLRPAIVQQLAQAARWLCRRRVRMCLLLNPWAACSVTMPLLGLCTRGELREIIDSADAPVLLRATAIELIERRPPLDHSGLELPLQ